MVRILSPPPTPYVWGGGGRRVVIFAKKVRTIWAILSPGTRTMCAISLAKCFSFLSSCLSHPQIFTVGRFDIHAVLYSEILHNCYRLACNSLMAKKGLHGHKKGLNQVQSLVRTCTVFFYHYCGTYSSVMVYT